MRQFVAVVLAALLPGVANAAENDPLRGLLDELGVLVEQAEKTRAADPRFLGDLRAVLERYDDPWSVRLIADDFADGDYTRSPRWRVVQGAFSIAWDGGLLSEVPIGPSGGRQDKRSAADLAADLLEGFLNDEAPRRSSPRRAEPAEIHLPRSITNAFSLTAVVAPRRAARTLEFLVYQGTRRDAGYRLILRGDMVVVLAKQVRSKSSVIGTDNETRIRLDDGADHEIVWTRDVNGLMVVTIDGERVLRRGDSAFRDPFDGFALINRGGEFVLRSIVIAGGRS